MKIFQINHLNPNSSHLQLIANMLSEAGKRKQKLLLGLPLSEEDEAHLQVIYGMHSQAQKLFSLSREEVIQNMGVEFRIFLSHNRIFPVIGLLALAHGHSVAGLGSEDVGNEIQKQALGDVDPITVTPGSKADLLHLRQAEHIADKIIEKHPDMVLLPQLRVRHFAEIPSLAKQIIAMKELSPDVEEMHDFTAKGGLDFCNKPNPKDFSESALNERREIISRLDEKFASFLRRVKEN